LEFQSLFQISSIHLLHSSSTIFGLACRIILAKEATQIFLPILLITIIPISGWIFWNVKKGNYTNMDVSNRNERKSLYFFIAAAIIAYLFFDYFNNGNIDLVMIFLLILLLVMQLSNYFIKSSMHTAFNVFVAALFFAKSPALGNFLVGNCSFGWDYKNHS
jgi:phosphatidylglycerophosphate synthase